MIGFAVIVGAFVSKPPAVGAAVLVAGIHDRLRHLRVLDGAQRLLRHRGGQGEPAGEAAAERAGHPRAAVAFRSRSMLAVGMLASGLLLNCGRARYRRCLRLPVVALQLPGEEIRHLWQPDRGVVAGDPVHLRGGRVRRERHQLPPALHGLHLVPLRRGERGREGHGRHRRRRQEGR